MFQFDFCPDPGTIIRPEVENQKLARHAPAINATISPSQTLSISIFHILPLQPTSAPRCGVLQIATIYVENVYFVGRFLFLLLLLFSIPAKEFSFHDCCSFLICFTGWLIFCSKSQSKDFVFYMKL